MHKQTVNELCLHFSLEPQSPLLIKSGRESGADPNLPDMNFVRIDHALLGQTVYLPGSSLKGVLRAHAERIARTLNLKNVCDPLGAQSCGKKVETLRRQENQAKPNGADIYRTACPICRIFGHTAQASHLSLSDAYPQEAITTADLSTRDGVAIDRISGAVAYGPFTIEVVTRGRFGGRLYLHNFQLWQVGLLAIVLRDLGQGRVPLGYGKSRGLGRVSLTYEQLEIAYPGYFEPSNDLDFARRLYGVGALPVAEGEGYDFEPDDEVDLPSTVEVTDHMWGRPKLVIEGPEAILPILKATVPKWKNFANSTTRIAEGA